MTTFQEILKGARRAGIDHPVGFYNSKNNRHYRHYRHYGAQAPGWNLPMGVVPIGQEPSPESHVRRNDHGPHGAKEKSDVYGAASTTVSMASFALATPRWQRRNKCRRSGGDVGRAGGMTPYLKGTMGTRNPLILLGLWGVPVLPWSRVAACTARSGAAQKK